MSNPNVKQSIESLRGQRIEDILQQLYVIEGKSLDIIAAELGVSQTTVRLWLKQAGIPTRTRSEAVRALQQRHLRATGRPYRNDCFRYEPYLKSTGYVHIWCHGRPKNCGDQPTQHRVITQIVVGYDLEPEWPVHHINLIRHDNDPFNLALLKANPKHKPLHKYVSDHPEEGFSAATRAFVQQEGVEPGDFIFLEDVITADPAGVRQRAIEALVTYGYNALEPLLARLEIAPDEAEKILDDYSAAHVDLDYGSTAVSND